MGEISKSTITVLTVLFVLLSIMGTWVTLNYITKLPQVRTPQAEFPAGTVNLFVSQNPQPSPSSGHVNVNVISPYK